MPLLPFGKLKDTYKKINLLQKSFIVLAILVIIFFGAFYLGLIKIGAGKTYDCNKYPPAPNADVIRIENNQFNPQNLTVNVCNTILFLNMDSTDHWPKSSQFDAGHSLAKFDYFQYKVTKTGTYSFYDQMNKSIAGQIIIKDIK